MVLTIVCIFFALVTLLGLLPAWKTNNKRENIFFIICICIGFTVLLLRSMEIRLPDPTEIITELFRSVGIDR